MRYLVTGGAGFIGSHMTKRLLDDGHEVAVVDNLLSGFPANVDTRAEFWHGDVCDEDFLKEVIQDKGKTCDGIFHFAAIARTPWCLESPPLCMGVNVLGATVVLEVARQLKIKRVVLSSSNIVYAADTPYKVSKLALEMIGDSYVKSFGMSVVSLRYSNVYGKGQSEEGPSPNVFAALRKSKKENGKLLITGDGEQSRDYTHVSDIVEGNILAMQSTHTQPIDLCTGINTTLNEVAKFFDCPVEYIAERPGDIKHIHQDPKPAKEILGWEAKVLLKDGIIDAL